MIPVEEQLTVLDLCTFNSVFELLQRVARVVLQLRTKKKSFLGI